LQQLVAQFKIKDAGASYTPAPVPAAKDTAFSGDDTGFALADSYGSPGKY
jgi:hypothetical protein